ncbi:MAG: hypothetical protein K2P93_00915 [Alphaproteobacteria bacterium]|nr:hypothetical protein [Alphaproteobacteria bacterium]
MVFNKFTTLVVVLSFVFASEAFANRHGRHTGKQVCQKSERDPSHIRRRTPRTRQHAQNFKRDNKIHGRKHIRRDIPHELLSRKHQACAKKWAARKENRRLRRGPQRALPPLHNAHFPNSNVSGRKHLKHNFSHRRNNTLRSRLQKFQRLTNA